VGYPLEITNTPGNIKKQKWKEIRKKYENIRSKEKVVSITTPK
jgi:hypothetical protein